MKLYQQTDWSKLHHLPTNITDGVLYEILHINVSNIAFTYQQYVNTIIRWNIHDLVVVFLGRIPAYRPAKDVSRFLSQVRLIFEALTFYYVHTLWNDTSNWYRYSLKYYKVETLLNVRGVLAGIINIIFMSHILNDSSLARFRLERNLSNVFFTCILSYQKRWFSLSWIDSNILEVKVKTSYSWS